MAQEKNETVHNQLLRISDTKSPKILLLRGTKTNLNGNNTLCYLRAAEKVTKAKASENEEKNGQLSKVVQENSSDDSILNISIEGNSTSFIRRKRKSLPNTQIMEKSGNDPNISQENISDNSHILNISTQEKSTGPKKRGRKRKSLPNPQVVETVNNQHINAEAIATVTKVKAKRQRRQTKQFRCSSCSEEHQKTSVTSRNGSVISKDAENGTLKIVKRRKTGVNNNNPPLPPTKVNVVVKSSDTTPAEDSTPPTMDNRIFQVEEPHGQGLLMTTDKIKSLDKTLNHLRTFDKQSINSSTNNEQSSKKGDVDIEKDNSKHVQHRRRCKSMGTEHIAPNAREETKETKPKSTGLDDFLILTNFRLTRNEFREVSKLCASFDASAHDNCNEALLPKHRKTPSEFEKSASNDIASNAHPKDTINKNTDLSAGKTQRRESPCGDDPNISQENISDNSHILNISTQEKSTGPKKRGRKRKSLPNPQVVETVNNQHINAEAIATVTKVKAKRQRRQTKQFRCSSCSEEHQKTSVTSRNGSVISKDAENGTLKIVKRRKTGVNNNNPPLPPTKVNVIVKSSDTTPAEDSTPPTMDNRIFQVEELRGQGLFMTIDKIKSLDKRLNHLRTFDKQSINTSTNNEQSSKKGDVDIEKDNSKHVQHRRRCKSMGTEHIAPNAREETKETKPKSTGLDDFLILTNFRLTRNEFREVSKLCASFDASAHDNCNEALLPKHRKTPSEFEKSASNDIASNAHPKDTINKNTDLSAGKTQRRESPCGDDILNNKVPKDSIVGNSDLSVTPKACDQTLFSCSNPHLRELPGTSKTCSWKRNVQTPKKVNTPSMKSPSSSDEPKTSIHKESSKTPSKLKKRRKTYENDDPDYKPYKPVVVSPWMECFNDIAKCLQVSPNGSVTSDLSVVDKNAGNESRTLQEIIHQPTISLTESFVAEQFLVRPMPKCYAEQKIVEPPKLFIASSAQPEIIECPSMIIEIPFDQIVSTFYKYLSVYGTILNHGKKVSNIPMVSNDKYKNNLSRSNLTKLDQLKVLFQNACKQIPNKNVDVDMLFQKVSYKMHDLNVGCTDDMCTALRMLLEGFEGNDLSNRIWAYLNKRDIKLEMIDVEDPSIQETLENDITLTCETLETTSEEGSLQSSQVSLITSPECTSVRKFTNSHAENKAPNITQNITNRPNGVKNPTPSTSTAQNHIQQEMLQQQIINNLRVNVNNAFPTCAVREVQVQDVLVFPQSNGSNHFGSPKIAPPSKNFAKFYIIGNKVLQQPRVQQNGFIGGCSQPLQPVQNWNQASTSTSGQNSNMDKLNNVVLLAAKRVDCDSGTALNFANLDSNTVLSGKASATAMMPSFSGEHVDRMTETMSRLPELDNIDISINEIHCACGAVAFFACPCKQIHYCSSLCQRNDWQRHCLQH